MKNLSADLGTGRKMPRLFILGSTLFLGVLAFALPFASGLDSSASRVLAEGHRALRAFDLPAARDIAAGLSPPQLATPDVRYFLGRLAFYEGRYHEAVTQFGDVRFTDGGGREDDFPAYVRDVAAAVEGLSVRESAHFKVFYDAEGPDAILPDYTLEVLEKSLAVLSAELDYVPGEKIRVEIYPDSRRFIAASGLKGEEIETTGTVALCIYNKLMITSPRALALGYRWMDTLSHELVHLLVAKRSRNAVPVWLQEGFAKFFEVRWRGGRGADMSPASESLLAEALQADKLVPFERMSPSLAKLPSAEEAQLAFAQVQTVIEYVITQKGVAGLHRIIDEMAEGKSDRQAMEAVLEMPFASFEAEWQRFMRAKRLKTQPGVAVLPTILKAQEALAADAALDEEIEDPFMNQYKELREFSRLGDLLRERGRFRAALIEYSKARERSPVESPALSVKIALTHLDGKSPAEAIRVLDGTIQRYPSFAPAFTIRGMAQVETADWPSALKSFQEANAINPFDPFVHQNLAQLYGLTGDTAASTRERSVLARLVGSP